MSLFIMNQVGKCKLDHYSIQSQAKKSTIQVKALTLHHNT